MVRCIKHSNSPGVQTVRIGGKCMVEDCNMIAQLSKDKKRIIWVEDI